MEDFQAGVFLIDKPEGPSSFAVVRDVRRLFGIKKVGHAGTLDPFASGLLIICVGRAATRIISRFMNSGKEYVATVRLGIETTTHDPEGEIVASAGVDGITREKLLSCLQDYSGEILQTPPAYSALKHKGKPLYYYARKGIEIKKEPRKVTIEPIQWLNQDVAFAGDFVDVVLRISCSKGTYIRSLAADIGRALGSGGHLVALRRTRSGNFSVEDAFPGAQLREEGSRERLLENGLAVDTVLNLFEE